MRGSRFAARGPQHPRRGSRTAVRGPRRSTTRPASNCLQDHIQVEFGSKVGQMRSKMTKQLCFDKAMSKWIRKKHDSRLQPGKLRSQDHIQLEFGSKVGRKCRKNHVLTRPCQNGSEKNMIPDSDLANLDPKTTFSWNLGPKQVEHVGKKTCFYKAMSKWI